jgi:hypothetical protein
MRRLLAFPVLVLAALSPAGSAAADGLPLPVDGADDASVAQATGTYRYAAVSNGGKTTVLKIVSDGGRIFSSRTFGGEFSVPLVAYNGTASGLSADGERLALIKPRPSFPRKTTDLLVLNATNLKPVQAIHLDGDFSFDAISPDGRRLYLVHYRGRNPLDYEVRAYDVARERFLPHAIVDPDEPGEKMAGFPLDRTTSSDGRWAYTLYGGGDATFIHALDTQGSTAQCIDLENVRARDMYQLGLNMDPDSGKLTVLDGARPVALVDTQTFAVSEPAEGIADTAPTADAGSGGSTWLAWAAIGGGLALVGAATVLMRRRQEAAR